ncbi:MAG TPA: LamG domain-containing protein [Bryobacteraceae bacterium]|jgi:hypothetical protein
MTLRQTLVCQFLFAVLLPGQTPETIVRSRCLQCHNHQLDNNGLSFENRQTVVPRSAKILAAIAYTGDIKMPPGTKLPASEISILTRWVEDGAPPLTLTAQSSRQFPFEMWTFDRLNNIAGYPTHVEGHPRVIDSPVGKAVEFNGIDDALFIDDHPLAEASTFTWEVIFRPDKGGHPEQRFFHLQEQEQGKDTQNRFLFEIRVTGDEWYLDSFVMSPTGSKTLMNNSHHHPLGEWYHVAQVYDGHVYRNYVNGVLENEGELKFTPNQPGHTSVGVRINHRDYFKGAVARSRFTRGALDPSEFLKVPGRP